MKTIVHLAERMAMCNESVFGVLKRIPGHEAILFHYDNGKEAQAHYEGEVDHGIMRYFNQNPADYIIYEGPAEGKCRPQIETFHWLRTKAKTICLVNDGGCQGWWPALQAYKDADCFDLVLNQDGCPEWPKRPQDKTTLPLLDSSFFKPKEKRDLFFAGIHSFSSPHRDKATKFILENCGFKMGHRSDQWGDYQDYANFLCNTTVTINFPESGGGSPMIKFRTIEAGYAKCLLIEKANPITQLYFTPGEDYISYQQIEELPFILKTLTKPDVDRISSNLHRKTLGIMPTDIWKTTLESL